MSPVLDSVLPATDLVPPHAPPAQVPWWRLPAAQIALPLGASVLLVAVVLAAAAWSLRVRTLHSAQQQALALAQVAAEVTSRALLSLESAPPQLPQWWELDAQGRVRASAPGMAQAPAALDAAQWQELQRDPGRILLQALPATARDAAPLLLLVRALHAPDGRFAGARLAVLPLSHLGSLWQQARPGPLGRLALYGTQGQLLLRSPWAEGPAPPHQATAAILARLSHSSGGAFIDGRAAPQLYAYQALQAPLPAMVVLTQPLDQALAPWRQWVWVSTALWGLLALGGAGAGWQLQRHTRLRNQSTALAQRQTRRLRELSRRILDAQEAERSRVARELHDELGQSLTAIKINLQAQAQFKNADPAQWQADNLSMVEEALQQVRRLSLGLRPSILDTLGLTPALQWMGRELSQRSHFAFVLEQDPHWPALDDDTQTCLFRIAQEALTNVARHAQARQVQIALRAHGEQLVMEIRDDGQGFDPAARRRAHHSMGLSSMAERAALVGGRLGLASAPGQGCTISVSIPHSADTPP
ncbi:MAG: histidine kinase [Rhodoferax sp.]